jgi:hypothetical protein
MPASGTTGHARGHPERPDALSYAIRATIREALQTLPEQMLRVEHQVLLHDARERLSAHPGKKNAKLRRKIQTFLEKRGAA